MRTMRAVRGAVPVLGISLGVLLAAGVVFAGSRINVSRDGLALKGYDPVAYFDQGEPVQGSEKLTATHEGATYRFSSRAHLEAFRENPARYVPAYGGWCAYAVSRGKKAKIDPRAFRIHEGRLYLNYDRGIQRKWEKDIPGYLARSEAAWPRISDVDPDDL